ncbi:hypothetical protein ABZ814_13500 [Micromonospora musae]|uniref:hypothetical protein n=1 Tax=Micromonospora musae TaxID=1894970 RepID=UPI0033DF8EF7
MGLVRYRPNRKGIRGLLGAGWVRANLHARAELVAAAAEAAYTADPPHSGQVDVVVESESGVGTRVRSRAAVIAKHPAALPIEADRRPLGSALDAARVYTGGG